LEGASIEPIGGCNETGTWPATAEAPPAEASAARRRLLEVEGEGGPSCLPWEQRVDNCRCGHTGPVCGVCKEGWALAGDLCVQCTVSEAFVNWPRARLAGFLFIMFFIFMVLSIALLWDELLYALARKAMPEAVSRLRSLSSPKAKGAEAPTLVTRLSRLVAVIGFCQCVPCGCGLCGLAIHSRAQAAAHDDDREPANYILIQEAHRAAVAAHFPQTHRCALSASLSDARPSNNPPPGDLEFFNFSFLTCVRS